MLTMTSNKKVDEGKNNFGQVVVAAVTGAIAGAGVAIAGAIALTDEKNRKKVDESIAKVVEKKDEVKEKIAQGKVKVKKIEKIIAE